MEAFRTRQQQRRLTRVLTKSEIQQGVEAGKVVMGGQDLQQFVAQAAVDKVLQAFMDGLRQTILETIDEAHPEAFRRMLRLIVDHDLTRFSATVRAVDIWFGFGWESVSNRVVKEVLVEVLGFLENPALREEVLGCNEPQRHEERVRAASPTGEGRDNAQGVFLALWTLAFEDTKHWVKKNGNNLTKQQNMHLVVEGINGRSC